MSIRRTEIGFESRFTQIPNEWLRDKRLSRKARGLLAELMTHRVGWTITLASLLDNGPEGKDALYSAIRELKEFHYLTIDPKRNAAGKFAETEWIITDPADYPDAENPDAAEPDAANHPPKNTSSLRTLEKIEEQDDSLSIDVDLSIPAGKSSTIPNHFALTREMVDWAEKNTPSVDVRSATRDFIEYWRVGDGARKQHKNWMLTWKNNMRKIHGWNLERQAKSGPVPKNGLPIKDEWWLR